MKKKIWLLNHYATNSYFSKGDRHYWFAENLIKKGYEPVIFCATTRHNTKDVIDTKGKKFISDQVEGIPFVFVKTPKYKSNGVDRIINMLTFYCNLFFVAKDYVKANDKPDVILASSVHPLTLVAGIKIAHQFGIPCICEVRDLWPESIIEFDNLNRNSIVAKLLFCGEKWIYKKADRLIFTMEGGRDYIIDKRWSTEHGGPIFLEKINHINNGISLKSYEENITKYPFNDKDLDDYNCFKVIYAGSIRKANNVGLILDAAKYVEKINHNIKFLVFGDGDEKESLIKRCKIENINNIVFKGRVDKKLIPSILSKSDLNILNYENHDIWKYGGSQNKNFEYLASGKPILCTIEMGYDIIKKYNAGISLKNQSPESIGAAIISFATMDKKEYEKISENAKNAALDYDFMILTNKLIDIIKSLE